MPQSSLYLPPIAEDLWPVLRARIDTAAMAAIFGGAGRLFVEGDYGADPPWLPGTAGGRGVIMPALPAGVRWQEGLPMQLRWWFRVDMPAIEVNGVRPAVWASRKGQAAHREAARRWANWNPNEVLVSNQIMSVGSIELDEPWGSKVTQDPDRTGTVFMSASYILDVASASD